MNRTSHAMAVAVAASLWLGSGHGQPQELGVGTSARPPASKPRPAARPMFAAESAATAHRLEPQEREARRILKEAAASSRLQVDAARLALARSSDGAVRSLATTLSTQQVAAGNELLRLLHQRGMAAPMLGNSQRRELTRLGKLRGVRFDREYIATVIAEAQDELALCDKAGAAVQDPAIAAWIARASPELQYDIENAQRLATALQAAHPGKERRAVHAARRAHRGVSGSSSR